MVVRCGLACYIKLCFSHLQQLVFLVTVMHLSKAVPWCSVSIVEMSGTRNGNGNGIPPEGSGFNL